MKKPLVAYPFLFAIFPVLSLFSHNVGQVLFSEVWLPLAVVVGFAGALFAALRLLLRDSQRAGLVVFILLVMVFFYSHVFRMAQGVFGFSDTVFMSFGYLLGWGLMFIGIAYWMGRKRWDGLAARRHVSRLTKILNLVAACLVIIPLINIAAFKLQSGGQPPPAPADDSVGRPRSPTPLAVDSTQVGRLPDIYYIVFDRYASARTLKEVHDFDNSQFIDYLTSKGFYVAAQARANYLKTAHSLASSLNMEFLDDLSEQLGEDSSDWTPLYARLQDYNVWRFLKARGYRFVHFGSWWYQTSRNQYADVNVNLYWFPEFSKVLYETTAFYPLGLRLGIYDGRREQWERVLYKFDKLAEIPDIQEPTFVFAHMLIPHDPYVFDQDGRFLTIEELSRRTRRDNYINQLVFTNAKLKILIDGLLSRPEDQPIIILQADEGPFPPRYEQNEHTFDWHQATTAELREKMGILNAYYLPGVDKEVLYPSITPVNTFRLIFNLYFKANLELLPDKSHAFDDESHPYKFFDVTDKLK